MNNIIITALIATYNGGESVLRSLDSIKEQTYPFIDLVICDDSSTDSGYTISIIENWIENNKNFFIKVDFIKNPQNLGIVKNIKNAASFAKGEIIFPLGQGDMCYHPNTFTQIVEEIRKQRQSGLEDPYFWLGQYMGFKIENEIFKPIQLYKDLPHQHELLTKNPYKALKINLRKWEIGGVGILYNAKYFDDNIFPLKDAPRNWEDGPAFLWALIEGHRIGTLPIMLRWYEVGTGISWEINRKTKTEKIKRIYHRVFDKLKRDYVNPYTKDNQTTIDWLRSLTFVNIKTQILVNDYIRYLETDEIQLHFGQLIIFTCKKTYNILMSKIRKIYTLVIFKLNL